MKRICVVLAIVLSFSFVLTSCGGSGTSDVSSQTDGKEDMPSDAGNKAPADKENESAKTSNNESNKISAEDEWVYCFNGNGVTICEYIGTDSNVIIPMELKVNGSDRKVTEIKGELFSKMHNASLLINQYM